MRRTLILIFLLCLPSAGAAQWTGPQPMSRKAQLDSLSALEARRVVTQVLAAADSARLDSLAAASATADDSLIIRAQRAAGDSARADTVGLTAGSNITITGTAPHRYTIASTASGGGSSAIPVPVGQSLSTYYNRNVVQIVTLADKADWADQSDYEVGTHGHDQTNYKTDTTALLVNVTVATAGAHLSKAIDIDHWANGDSAYADSSYICWNLYISQNELDSIPSGGDIYIEFSTSAFPTRVIYYYVIDKSVLAAGWNYFKILKSAFTTYGSPKSWGNIQFISVMLLQAPTAGTVTFTLDNFQMIRRAAATAYPNPFWTAGNALWTETATSGLTIHRRDTLGIQSMVSGNYLTSTVIGIDTLSGRTILSQTDSTILSERASGDIKLKGRGGTKILLLCSGGVGDSLNYNYAAGDTLSWKLIRGTAGAYTATVRKNSDADSTLTGTYSGVNNKVRIRLIGNDRLLDLPALLSNTYKISVGGMFFFVTADSISTQ
ncbi:MAG: hypothetical protein WC455_14590 [Dehalococcoidia bacterium]|jgi:hypothetical protein